MQQSSNLLRDFVAQLLEGGGALVERIDPVGLEFVAPRHLQEILHIPEVGRLGFASELPEYAQRVSFESDWLDHLGQVLGERGQVARRVLNMTTPAPSDPERILEHGLILHNAVYRFLRVTPAWSRYLLLTFRYSALSDEKREGVLQFGVNLSNGSTLDGMLEPLLLCMADVKPEEETHLLPGAQLPPLWSTMQFGKLVRAAIPSRIRHGLTPYLDSLQRRLDRDLTRVHEYYAGLCREALLRLQKQGTEAGREQLRLEAIAREYEAKVADLRQKYALRIEVKWIQTLELILPVHRFELLLKRRKGERRFHLDWNPAARRLEPPPCEYSYTWQTGRMVCDDALHLVSLAGHGDCPSCAKAYCRACYPQKCPRCTSGDRIGGSQLPD